MVRSDTLHFGGRVRGEGDTKFAILNSPTLCLFVLLVNIGWRQCGVLGSEEDRSVGRREFMPQFKRF